jgi:hypothetical protein
MCISLRVAAVIFEGFAWLLALSVIYVYGFQESMVRKKIPFTRESSSVNTVFFTSDQHNFRC